MIRTTRRFYQAGADHKCRNILSPLTYTKDSMQYKVLNRALKEHVPKHGFNEFAISKAASELGYSSSVFSVLSVVNSPSVFNLSPSVLELVKFNLVTKRLELKQEAKTQKTLEELFVTRVAQDIPISAHVSQLMSILVMPGQFLVDTSLPELFQLADDMIYFSVEKDHNDLSWYAKRLAVAMAYVSTKLFMVRDRSSNHEWTLEFAKNRVRNIDELGSMYNNIEEFAWYQLLTTINLAKSQMIRG